MFSARSCSWSQHTRERVIAHCASKRSRSGTELQFAARPGAMAPAVHVCDACPSPAICVCVSVLVRAGSIPDLLAEERFACAGGGSIYRCGCGRHLAPTPRLPSFAFAFALLSPSPLTLSLRRSPIRHDASARSAPLVLHTLPLSLSIALSPTTTAPLHCLSFGVHGGVVLLRQPFVPCMFFAPLLIIHEF